MKKLIPFLVAFGLIIIILGVSFGAKIKEKYSYSKERADLNEYFQIVETDDVPIILQDEIIAEKAKKMDGTYYFDLDTVRSNFCKRFYINTDENTVRYVMPDRIIQTNIGEPSYLDGDQPSETFAYPLTKKVNDTLYLSVDFVRLFSTFDYEVFTEPDRMQIYTSYSERQVASITKDTQVRYQGGVKSDILCDISTGDKIVVLEPMENWTKVKTLNGFIGYVENKMLSEQTAETPVFADTSSKYGDAEFSSISRDNKINLAWHQIGGQAGNDTFDSVISQTKGVNVISPTWFYLSDNEGNFNSYASSEYVEKAHAQGIEVWALIDNFTADVDCYSILSSSQKRATLISGLMNAVTTYDLDGINIDFEQISNDEGPHFVEFIRELSIPCRANGIVLSVDNYVPEGGSSQYNRKEQGVYADYLIIMGYDEHWGSGGEAGSVASINFVENGIKDTIEEVPANKVLNAIPFYTRIWKTNGADVVGESVGMGAAKQFVADNGIQTVWDEETCQNYGEAQIGDTFYQVWLEDEKSVEVKLNIMRNYDLAGIAEWKLGLEQPAVWDLIQAYVAQ